MSDFISKGPSITVSTSDLESKIDATTGKFVKNLSKSQKALGLTIDEMGRYVNAQGKCVEGLTQTQIKLGQYVDEMGVLHTENGGLVADLNKIEQALGFYADEWGVVRNAQHEAVRFTAEARKEVADRIALNEKEAKIAADLAEKKARAAEKAAKSQKDAERELQKELEKTERLENEAKESAQRRTQILGQTFGAFAQLSGQFATLLATVESTDDTVGGFRSTLIQLSEAASVGFGTFQSLYLAFNNVSKGLAVARAGLVFTTATAGPASAALAGVGTAATTASVGIKALQVACGPVGMILAAAGAALAAFATTGHKSSDETSNLSEHFKELEERANALGKSINGVKDALTFGAFKEPTSEMMSAARALDDARAKLQAGLVEGYRKKGGWFYGKEAVEAAKEMLAQPDSFIDYQSMFDSLRDRDKKWAEPLLEEYRNQLANMDENVAAMMKTASDSVQTEVEKLERKMDEVSEVWAVVKAKGNKEGAKVLEDYYFSLDDKLQEAKKNEIQEAEKTAKAERDKLLESLGALEFVKKENEARKKTVETIDDFYRFVEKEWGDALEEGTLSTQEYADAVAGLARSFKSENLDDYLEIADSLRDAYSQEIMSADQAAEALKVVQNSANELLKSKYGLDLDAPKIDANSVEGVNAALNDLRSALSEAIIDSEQFKRGSDQLAKRMADVVFDGFEKGDLSFQKASETLGDAIADGVITIQEFNGAIERLEDKAKESLSAELGVSFEKELDYSDKLAKLQNAFDDGVLAKNEYEDAKKQLLDAARQAIPGVESLISTAEASFDATLESLQKALDEKIIEQDEYDRLVQQAQETLAAAYEKQAKKASDFDDASMKKAWERAQKDEEKRKASEKKSEPAKSVSSGSEALYLAQVKNSTANFQSRVQSTTENIYKTSREALYQSQQTNWLLQELVEGAGNAPVFG